ncbi:MAG: amidohydrolase family protein [Burkholderiaceae bacterium]
MNSRFLPCRIDAHQHFWQVARGDYDWLRADVPALRPLYRNFLPRNLSPLLRRHGVTQTVVVQAAPTEAETEFLLTLADDHDWIGGVVGGVDLSQPAAALALERWARHPKFKGVRPMLQDLGDVEWIARAPNRGVMHALVDLNLRFDALVRPQHLAALLQFLRRYPDLPVVIDHAAKPQIAAGWQADWAAVWRRDMAEIAAHPNVVCKLSGLLTETAWSQNPSLKQAISNVRPVWNELLGWFGPERLLWGSDWPVLSIAADFDRWVSVCDALIGELPARDQARIWHDNACRFYGLEDRGARA